MPSNNFLEFKRKMKEKERKNNTNNLFGIYKIPSDNHMINLGSDNNPRLIF